MQSLKQINEQFDKLFPLADKTIFYTPSMREAIKHWWLVTINEILEDYTSWLAKHQYTDSDTWAEEPKAVDRYLKEIGY